jgi:branched-chain amino acid transport system permease protein
MDTATSTTSGAPAAVAPAAAARRLPLRGRAMVWGGYALVLLLAPLVFSSSLGVSMLSQIGIAIVACLSYNILLGQGGMLSFGHAVYTGLATFVSIHAMLGIASGAFPVPMSLIPVVGGLAGAFFAVLLGYVTTKKAGTPFAMITLGIGELVAAMVLMIPEFFGGEGGVSANRQVGKPFLGITFGPPIQVYYLIAVYTFLCTAGMFAFTRTPLGRMLNAVRDNPERVEFIGYSTQRVRYLSFIIAGFFAGVAGGMYALNFEIATAEVVGGARSGIYLFFTFLGGATFFFGPIIGAVLMVVAFTLLSELTRGWPLYLGLVFILMVMFAPGGIASLIMMNVRLAAHHKLARVAVWYPALLATGLVMLLGAAMLIELFYQLQLGAGNETHTSVIGIGLDTQSAASWIGGVAVLAVGAALFEWVRRRYGRVWGDVQTEIEAANAAREGR